MTNDPTPVERDVHADQTGIAAGGDVRQHAGRDTVGRDLTTIDQVVVNLPMADSAAKLDDEQHARFTEQVRRWYRIRLAQALDRVVSLELGLDTDAAAVAQPLDRFMPRDRSVQSLPAGTTVLDVFTTAGGEQGGLLILGDPGAGKTTLLFDLAVALTAVTNTSRRTPVYLPLSTWQQRRRPLAEWLASQLNELYFVPPEIAGRWVQTGRVLPLLDGLDEIGDPDARAACVAAINQFRRQFSLPVVVCSRRLDYQALPVQLALEAAVTIRPLDSDAVLRHLRQGGRPFAGVRAVFRDDPDLLEFCRSPLLLSMLTLTYYDQSATQLRTGGSPEQRRERLFNDYINRRLDLLADEHSDPDEGGHAETKRQRTLHWLATLAHNLTRHDQKVFLLERMQPDWLPTKRADTVVAFTAAVVVAGIVMGVCGPVFGVNTGLILGVPYGLVYGLVLRFGGAREPTERLTWSWRTGPEERRSWRRVGIRVGIRVGAIFSAVSWGVLITGVALSTESPTEIMEGLLILLVGLPFVAFIGGLVGGLVGTLITTLLSRELLTQRSKPNEGIRRSLTNSIAVLLMSLLFGLIVGAVLVIPMSTLTDGLVTGLFLGLLTGPIVALFYGLGAVLKYGILRVLLWRYHSAPLRYVRWLEQMVQARLLYRVGGGYEFVHGLLRDYLEGDTAAGFDPSPAKRWLKQHPDDLSRPFKRPTILSAAILSMAILSLVGLGVYAYRARVEAERQRRLAYSRELAVQSKRIVARQPDLAILLGLQSLSFARDYPDTQLAPPLGLVTGLARLSPRSEIPPGGPTSLRQFSCKIVKRNMSLIEWRRFIPDAPYERTCPELPSGQGVPPGAPALSTTARQPQPAPIHERW